MTPLQVNNKNLGIEKQRKRKKIDILSRKTYFVIFEIIILKPTQAKSITFIENENKFGVKTDHPKVQKSGE